MTEAKKVAIVVVALMLVAALACVFEYLQHRINKWLTLIIVSVILLLMALSIHQVRAHDHARPELNDWLKSLRSKNNTWCCDGRDHDPIDDWEAKDNRYRVKFRGQWYDVPETAIVDGPNKAGDAMLWMNKGYLGVSVRCFVPGALT
jgi:hypothetical protein